MIQTCTGVRLHSYSQTYLFKRKSSTIWQVCVCVFCGSDYFEPMSPHSHLICVIRIRTKIKNEKDQYWAIVWKMWFRALLEHGKRVFFTIIMHWLREKKRSDRICFGTYQINLFWWLLWISVMIHFSSDNLSTKNLFKIQLLTNNWKKFKRTMILSLTFHFLFLSVSVNGQLMVWILFNYVIWKTKMRRKPSTFW